MAKKVIFDLPEILKLLPHREPFLFVDNIIEFKPNKRIAATRFVRPDEPFFKGHFPFEPIMPGVLITDALAQTSGLLWGFTEKESGSDRKEGQTVFFLASDNIKYVKPVRPGETLILESTFIDSFGKLFKYKVEALVNNKTVCKGNLTLAIQDRTE